MGAGRRRGRPGHLKEVDIASRAKIVVTFLTGLVVGYGVLYLQPSEDGPPGGMQGPPPGQEGPSDGPPGEGEPGPAPDGPVPEVPVGELPPPGPDALPPLGEGVEEIPVDVPHFEEPKDGATDGSSALRAHLTAAPQAWRDLAQKADGDLAAQCQRLADTADRMDPLAPPVAGVAQLIVNEHLALAQLDEAGIDASELRAQVDALRFD